ncbi:spermatogenesis associated 6-like protein [Maniola hyperantus]|uniref:spermatogenesis associated 6-like protein n=1 Tax=Aphantopus hyperantus TaxID=2795564 RepID=UPI0015686940|nr:spermatogenesis-associated protein 6 [Maniola hyperantus]
MPKLIELTIEIEVQKVSCPGVWLCQDGRVSLTIFALGTSYQTCLLPPSFPLAFRDVFYFRKRFQESCALNNICCLLKDETIYCELVQWCENCTTGNCVILAQYLGAMNDVLFPPNMCSSDGVDLLMRRSKDFPGILSPKIEISTKVRIDEVWNSGCMYNMSKTDPCHCGPKDLDGPRQKQVCHSAQYHRTRCHKNLRSRSRSRSRSIGSRSCCSVEADVGVSCRYPKDTDPVIINPSTKDERLQKLLLESRYIDQDLYNNECTPRANKKHKLTPCVCEICRKYHELFHSNTEQS